MASGSEHLRPHLHEYLVAHATPPDALLRDLIAETAERFPGNVICQIGPEQGTFMTLLASLMRGYWDELVPRMRPGGMILVDNTLLHGRIFADSPDPDALAMREFNSYVLADDRVELVMLPVGDGLTLARAR